MSATHVVLIRGINVGGKNPVPMARLRGGLQDAGLTQVRTYIQSGNALVWAPDLDEAAVNQTVEHVLAALFDVHTVVVTVTAATLRRALDAAPEGFGDDLVTYHCDVAFLRQGLGSEEALAAFGIREGVDEAWAGDGVVYFRRASALRAKSRMSKVASSSAYKDMTIRNWNTSTTLARMLADDQ